jgi:glycosyltransferase involved in cell wall biosynthesis
VCSRSSQFSQDSTVKTQGEALRPSRLALCFDYPEEKWASMDLCAQMLYEQLQTGAHSEIEAVKVCPPFNRRWQRFPKIGQHPMAFNLDRLLNRQWDYLRQVKPLTSEFDYFHVCDHTYAALVHSLPSARTGVYCHDIDAFRSLVTPEQEPRPAWFRAMSRRILTGLQKAAIVFYSTQEVRREIEAYRLIAPERLIQAPLGIATEFTPASSIPDQSQFETWWPQRIRSPYLLHVGSCIPRKRIDVLLDVFGQLRQRYPHLQLVKVSGDWTAEQQAQIDHFQMADAIVHLHNLERVQIAALYRQATLVLLPSAAEGFGIPVIEALACGATVVASDIPVLREVGGESLIFCPMGEITSWVETITQLLQAPGRAPAAAIKQAQAALYSWQNHAQIIAQAYCHLDVPRYSR